MKRDYFLRPINSYFKKDGSIAYKDVEVLSLDKNINLKVENNLGIVSEDISVNKVLFNKYKNLRSRINNITNPSFPSQLSNFNKPILMGIVNVTQDSFFDGSNYFKYENAIKHAEKLIKDGANIIDVGGESTKPGSLPIAVEEEIRRVKPIIKELSKNNIIISCDTRNSITMQVALDSGATIINDVSGLNYDKQTPKVLEQYDCLYVLMHSIETPITMQNNPIYNNVACDIYSFFKEKILVLEKMNISNKRIILDPGIGFGKKGFHNFSLIKNLNIFLDIGNPIMIGLSRKSFIKKLVHKNSLVPSVLLAIKSYLNGAQILRVHDVKETSEAINILDKVN